MKAVKEIKYLDGKKILLRVGFNVPLAQPSAIGHRLLVVGENYHIKAHKETIDFLSRSGAKILLISHHSEDDISFADADFLDQIEDVLDRKILFIQNLEQANMLDKEENGAVALLDNIRKYSGEKKNDEEFALSLSKGFDFYINDAFSVSHRKHASISAITKFLPSYAGFLLKKEITQLSAILEKPAKGKILIIGGAKVETKAPVIKNFLDRAEKILLGGTVANNFLKAKGFEIGKSIFDENYIEELKPLFNNPAIFIPEDVVISPDRVGEVEANPFPLKNIDTDHYILDIGPETAKHFSDLIKNSEMVIWNGPMGQFEVEVFADGTKKIIKAISETKAYTVIGGGDTVSAFNKFGNLDDVDFVSTGGGAMLEFLAGNKLPGLAVLDYYEQ